MANQWFGWKKDPYDEADVQYTDKLYDRFHNDNQQIDEKVDLRDQCPDMYDQGAMGSCTANAIAAALRFARRKKLGHDDSAFDPSRLYIYLNERMLSDSNGWSDDQKRYYDSGASMRIGIKSFNEFGVCPEYQWAYKTEPKAEPTVIGTDENGAEVKEDKWPENAYPCTPPEDLYTPEHKKEWRSYLGTELAYYRLGYDKEEDSSEAGIKNAAAHKVRQLKRCLSSGYPFIFGFRVYENPKTGFRTLGESFLDEKGTMRYPSDFTDLQGAGGHAVMAVGYNDGCFIIRNSWGADWGTNAWAAKGKDETMAGHFLMPEDWFLNANHTYDFWLIEAKTASEVPMKFRR